MKIVVAIDSLKGSLTSIQAGEAIEKGIKKVDLEAEVVIKPLADGGEGTVDALVDGMGGNMEFIKVTGPAGKPVLAKYGIIVQQIQIWKKQAQPSWKCHRQQGSHR